MDAESLERLSHPASDTPDFLQGRNRHRLFLTMGREVEPVDDAPEDGPVLGEVVGELRQRLRVGNAHAGRDSLPRVDPLLHGAPERRGVSRDPGNVGEVFIDRVALDPHRHAGQNRRDVFGDRPVELVVGASPFDLSLFNEVSELVCRHPPADAEGLRFRRERRHAPVVVREDYQGLSSQGGINHALAGTVELVGVDEADHLPGIEPREPLRPRESRGGRLCRNTLFQGVGRSLQFPERPQLFHAFGRFERDEFHDRSTKTLSIITV